MRKPRAIILLILTALSALTMFVVVLLDDVAGAAVLGDIQGAGAVPDTLAAYSETVIVGPDGNAKVEISTVVERGGSRDLLLPFDFDHATDFTILSGPAEFRRGNDGLPAPTRRRLGANMLDVQLVDSCAPGDTVRVTALVPDWYRADDNARQFGEFAISRTFVNRSAFVLRTARIGLVLPPGMTVHAVKNVVPAYDAKKNPEPPFSVSRRGGCTAVTLTAALVPVTTALQISLHMRPARRGPIPLIIGIVAAILYLILFRDILGPLRWNHRKAPGPGNDSRPDPSGPGGPSGR